MPIRPATACHLHISLVDAQGRNVFALDPDNDRPNDTLRWALGGLLETMEDYLAILCPNINSYRRFGQGFYVPTSPSWGIENRTTALRIPASEADATRIEHRLAGTDANPYLLMAAHAGGDPFRHHPSHRAPAAH